MRDESVSRVEETNSVATSLITTRRSGESTRRFGESTRRIGPIHDEMISEVDETNSVHNETNWNNDSTTRNANLVSDLTSYSSTHTHISLPFFSSVLFLRSIPVFPFQQELRAARVLWKTFLVFVAPNEPEYSHT